MNENSHNGPGTARADAGSVAGRTLRRRVWRYLGLIVACGLIGGLAAGVVISVRGAEYASDATVLLSPRLSVDPSADLEAARTLETEAKVLTSRAVLEAAADESGFTVQELVDSVEATAVTNTRLVRITAVGPSPEVAQRRAGAVVAAYQQYRIEAQGQEAADYGAYIAAELARIERSRASAGGGSPQMAGPANAALDDERERLLTDLEVVRSIGQAPSGGVSVIGPPSLPGSGSYLLTAIRDIALGVALGLLIGAAIAVQRAMTTSAVVSARDVEERFGLRVLGDVQLPADNGGSPDVADVRDQASPADVADLRRALAVRGVRCLVVAGVGDLAATTSTALRLGVAASAGTPVLLISACDHGSGPFSALDTGGQGLDAIAAGQALLDDVLVPPRLTGVPNLSFVPRGHRGDLLAILNSAGMETLMREAPLRWGLVVVVCAAADAPLVTAAEAAVLAVATGYADESQVEIAERGLHESGIPVLGVVLARSRSRLGILPRYRRGGGVSSAAPSPALPVESGV